MSVKRQQAGYVAYQWPRPGSDQPVDRISYVMGFEPWGWVIGSGVYVDYIEAEAMGQSSRAGTVTLGVAVTELDRMTQ